MNKSRSYFKPKSNVPAFLLKTYDILDNPIHADIISWNKEGTAFIVNNVNEFSEKILPKYFKHNNFSSFVRQLNMYDFHKSKQDSKENEFKHRLFRRGQKHLLSEIKRKGSENHHFPEDQIGNGPAAAELNKAKKSANVLNEELTTVKSQQGELEKMGKMIYSQNTQLLNENKLLWEELNKSKEKYEKKIEKLMMFVYSFMHQQPGSEAIGGMPLKKMLLNSESSDILKSISPNQPITSPETIQKASLPLTPENNGNNKSSAKINNYFQEPRPDARFDSSADQLQAKAGSPPLFNTPLSSGVSTLPNTPGVMPLMGNSNMMPGAYGQNMGYPANFAPMQNGANTYNAQAYFPENNTNNSPNGNHTATTSGNYMRRDNTKLTRPVPQMDLPESKEFKENPVKMVKKDSEALAQNSAQDGNLSTPTPNGTDPLKFDEWPINLSRGPSFNGGDLSMSRFNSLNVPRVPSSLEPSFSQWPLYIQSLKSNGDNYGLNIGKLESEGAGKNEMMNEEGLPCFSPNTFIRNGGVGGFNFGQNPEDSIYRN